MLLRQQFFKNVTDPLCPVVYTPKTSLCCDHVTLFTLTIHWSTHLCIIPLTFGFESNIHAIVRITGNDRYEKGTSVLDRDLTSCWSGSMTLIRDYS